MVKLLKCEYRVIIALLAMLYLVGCQSKDPEQYFLKHPNKIESIATACEMKMIDPKQEHYCQFAIDIKRELDTYKLEAKLNTYAFGKKILNAEIVAVRAALNLRLQQQQMQQVQQTKDKDSQKIQILQDRYQQQKMQNEAAERQVKWLLVVIKLVNQT